MKEPLGGGRFHWPFNKIEDTFWEKLNEIAASLKPLLDAMGPPADHGESHKSVLSPLPILSENRETASSLSFSRLFQK